MRIPVRPIRPGWWLDAVCLAGFVALTLALIAGQLLDLDLAVRDYVDAHRPDWAHTIGNLFNRLGNGSPLMVLCLVIALWRIRREHGAWPRGWRSWWPVYPIGFSFLLTFLTIGPIKLWTNRPAPRTPGTDGAFFDTAAHQSYPSGHAMNAFVWYTVLILLLQPWLSATWRRVIRVAPVAIVSVTTVYLGYHWLTDTVAGLLAGVVLARLVARVDWPAIQYWPSGEPAGAPPVQLT